MTGRLQVLVVDDETISRQTMVQQLRTAGYVADSTAGAHLALKTFAECCWDVVVTDLRMPSMDGLEFLRHVKTRFHGTEVILMTAFATVETAVLAMQEGAADYLVKPFSFAELDFRLKRLKQIKDSDRELTHLRALLGDHETTHGIIGYAPALRQVRERIQLFAVSDAPVLVTGETGTGKELVVRAIHDSGPRRARPFVPVACGAIPGELAESELFGHEKGAFTGAIARHEGCFEVASGGTLLLDDVDDLPLDIQVKLLRVLQEGTIRRVGAREDLAVDVRVIATTKIPLEQVVTAGRFRNDLFYRLRGLEITLPPLRERGDDVLLLAQHFLELQASKTGRASKRLSPDVAAVMRAYPWPGNVRELWRVIETFGALCPSEQIRAEHLPDFLVRARAPGRPYVLDLDHGTHVRLVELVEQFEDDVIDWALSEANAQQARAAALLGIPRTTLQSKLMRRKGT